MGPRKLESPHDSSMKFHATKQTHLTHMSSPPPPHGNEETTFIQAVAGTLLFYGRAVDKTILTALSSLTTKQAKPMAKSMAMAT